MQTVTVLLLCKCSLLSNKYFRQGLSCAAKCRHTCPAGAGVSGQHAFHYHVFPYHGVQLATSNFSNDNLVGEGGFGRVYKGQLADGTLVAVKRLDRHGLQVQPCVSLISISSSFRRTVLVLVGNQF